MTYLYQIQMSSYLKFRFSLADINIKALMNEICLMWIGILCYNYDKHFCFVCHLHSFNYYLGKHKFNLITNNYVDEFNIVSKQFTKQK